MLKSLRSVWNLIIFDYLAFLHTLTLHPARSTLTELLIKQTGNFGYRIQPLLDVLLGLFGFAFHSQFLFEVLTLIFHTVPPRGKPIINFLFPIPNPGTGDLGRRDKSSIRLIPDSLYRTVQILGYILCCLG